LHFIGVVMPERDVDVWLLVPNGEMRPGGSRAFVLSRPATCPKVSRIRSIVA
jgi:hypothetical protein